jgi:hypothetical protein
MWAMPATPAVATSSMISDVARLHSAWWLSFSDFIGLPE